MDDWDEIFKGPHWNLLANGQWATANFKPWCCIGYIAPLAGFELTTLLVICTDCTGSCKSNYHTIMATTPPPIILCMLSRKVHTLNKNNYHPIDSNWYRLNFDFFLYRHIIKNLNDKNFTFIKIWGWLWIFIKSIFCGILSLFWVAKTGQSTSTKHTQITLVWDWLPVLGFDWLIDLLCLMPLSAIFQLYHGEQF